MDDVFNTSNLFPSAGAFAPVPFVTIAPRLTDIVEPYYPGVSRLYLISDLVYGSPHFEQLLLLANPEWLSEHDIPDGTLLRIPFPLEDALQDIASFQTNWARNQTN